MKKGAPSILNEQTRQMQRIAEHELNELRESLRYVEFQLAKTKQENEELSSNGRDKDSEIVRLND